MLFFANNSLPVYHIPAKVGTEMHLYTPLLYANFQGNQLWTLRFTAVFVSVQRGRKIRRKTKTKKLSQFLESHISGMLEAILLKFGMWSTEVGGRVHSKNRLVSSRQHRATVAQKYVFVLSVNILMGVAHWLLGPHDTLPCVLVIACLLL